MDFGESGVLREVEEVPFVEGQHRIRVHRLDAFERRHYLLCEILDRRHVVAEEKVWWAGQLETVDRLKDRDPPARLQHAKELPKGPPLVPHVDQDRPRSNDITEASPSTERSSAGASRNSHRASTPISSASILLWSSRSREMSLKTTCPSFPTRSRAPKAIRPSPAPTSSRVLPLFTAAFFRIQSRQGSSPARKDSCCPGSPPKRRSSSHSAHLSRTGPATNPPTR